MDTVNEFIPIGEPVGEPIGEPVDIWPRQYYDTIRSLDEYFNSTTVVPVSEVVSEDCIVCKRTWASTERYPRCTRLCGHTMHMLCQMIYDAENNDGCPHPGCTMYGWAIVHNILDTNRAIELKKSNVAFDTVVNTPLYLRDLKGYKASIRNVRSAYILLTKTYRDAKKGMIHKHLHSINQIQMDMNAEIRKIKTGDVSKACRSALSTFRKKAHAFNLSHGVSFRDLCTRKIVKVNHSIRYMLERHRNHRQFNPWRFALRIKPGGRVLRDPLGGA